MNPTDLLLRHAIGFNGLQRLLESNSSNYPPHNIYRYGNDDNRYKLVLAVAGFTREEIEVTLTNTRLEITGTKSSMVASDFLLDGEDGTDVLVNLYSGLAFRDFRREFELGENVEVSKVTLSHGLLVIDLERRVPETLKPKRLAIA